jgi:phage protein U
MIGNVLMALGEYRFSIATAAYQKLERNTAWRWASQDRIGVPPGKQYIGPGDDTLSLDGDIFPGYRGGMGQVDSMRSQAGLGQPLPLTTGFGKYLGLWCITSIREGQEALMSDGAPRKMSFTIELEAYA